MYSAGGELTATTYVRGGRRDVAPEKVRKREPRDGGSVCVCSMRSAICLICEIAEVDLRDADAGGRAL